MRRLAWAAKAFGELAAIEAKRSMRLSGRVFAFVATLALLSAAALGPQLGLYGQKANGDVDDWVGIFNGRSFLDSEELPRSAEMRFESSAADKLQKAKELAAKDFEQVERFDATIKMASKEKVTLSEAGRSLFFLMGAKPPAAPAIEAREPDLIGIAGDVPPHAWEVLSPGARARTVRFNGERKDAAEDFIHSHGRSKDKIVVAVVFGSAKASGPRRAQILVEKPEGGDNRDYFGARVWAAAWMAETLELERVDRARNAGAALSSLDPAPVTIVASRSAKEEKAGPTERELSSRAAMLAMLAIAVACAGFGGIGHGVRMEHRVEAGAFSSHAKSPLPAWVLSGSAAMGSAAGYCAPVALGIVAAFCASSAFSGGLGAGLAARGIIACAAGLAASCAIQGLGRVVFAPGRIQRFLGATMSAGGVLWAGLALVQLGSQRHGAATLGAGWIGDLAVGSDFFVALGGLIACAVAAMWAAHARIGRFERRSLGDKL